MTNYKLKPEARQFFDRSFGAYVKPFKYWDGLGIHQNLLDEVKNVFIEYGKESRGVLGCLSNNLSGWDGNGGDDGNPIARFHFTVYVNNISYSDYRDVSIDELMDTMQKVLNGYFAKKE